MNENPKKNKKVNTTRKKVKFSGTQKYINQDTGEIVEMNVTEIEERDANFHKIWLAHIIQSLDLIGNKKVKVLNFILDNLNRENQFLMTYSMIQKETGIAKETIAKTMTALQESDFLKKVKSGHYEVNPDKIFKGGKGARMDILLRYKNLSKVEGDEEKTYEEQQKTKESSEIKEKKELIKWIESRIESYLQGEEKGEDVEDRIKILIRDLAHHKKQYEQLINARR